VSFQIRQSATDELQNFDNSSFQGLPPEKVIGHLSFTHLCELFPIKAPLKRMFYEVECIKGSWPSKIRRIETSKILRLK
jgi:hypothetical protein